MAVRVGPFDAEKGPEALAHLLVAVVDGGASVGFHRPLDPGVARTAAAGWLAEQAAGQRHVIAAEADGRCVGTVHLVPAMQENGQKRAEVQKLLVLPSHRRRGIGARLIRAVEAEAWQRGRRTLVLDTSSPTAARLYRALGWRHVGDVPDYASDPDGGLEPTAFHYRILEQAP